MQAGIKIGLKNYQEKILHTKASICEVHFRYNNLGQYTELFQMLKAKNIKAGLHFWSMLDGGIMYNLAYPDEKIKRETLDQLTQTIDLAAQNKLRYVNIHPGNLRLVKVDLERETFTDLGQEANQEEGLITLFENASYLTEYAQKRNVLFLVETVPSRYNPYWYNESTRQNPINVKDPKVAVLINLASNGIYITNDLAHTICDEISDDRDFLIKQLIAKTKALAKQTKLIHVNTTRAPFNGTDTHNGLLAEDFAQNVIPDRQQIIEILTLFKNRDDVWLIPEPLKDHEKNYLELQKIVRFIENS